MPTTSPPKAPYAIYVAVGSFVVAGAVAWLFLWSSKQVQPQKIPIVLPTSAVQVSVVPQTSTASDDVAVLGAEANAFDVNGLESEIGIIDQ